MKIKSKEKIEANIKIFNIFMIGFMVLSVMIGLLVVISLFNGLLNVTDGICVDGLIMFITFCLGILVSSLFKNMLYNRILILDMKK